jgi:hypothetical protein
MPAWVASLLMRLFSVPYPLRGTSYLLRWLGFTPVARQAANRTCMSSFKAPALWVEQRVPTSPSYLGKLRSNSMFQQYECIELDAVLMSRRHQMTAI